MKKTNHLLRMTLKVYRERGVLSLIKRSWEYVKEFFATFMLGSGDVLYISGCPGGSRFYRCKNQSEELNQHGISAKTISQDSLNLFWLVKKFNVFIFQRVIYNEHIKGVIEEIKKQGKMILFETDDLVFDPAYVPYMHYYQFMGEEEKSWYDNGIGREILEDPAVTHCVVSTHFLAEAIKKKYPAKTVFVSTNKLSVQQQECARKALLKKNLLKSHDGKIRIGYFSGSRSHDNDFETVSDVLLKTLKENKKSILMIVGHLKLNGFFDEVKNKIEYHSFVPLKKLPELILRCDINIAPLEIDNLFCQAKSALKFFEAGILEVPTIATATDSSIRTINHNENGFLVCNTDEWYRCLDLLINDSALRDKIGKRAREDSLKYYTIQTSCYSNNYIQFLLDQIRKKKQKVSCR